MKPTSVSNNQQSHGGGALSPNSSASNGKLFIGGLSYETTDESLEKYFAQFGPITSASVLRDQETNRSRGFGFVTFAHADSANNALSHHHHLVDGRKVEAKFAVPRRKTESLDDLDNIAPPTPSHKPMMMLNGTNGTNGGLMMRGTPTPTSARSSPTMFSPNTTTTSTTTAGGRSGGSLSPLPSGDIVANKIFVGGLRYATTHETLRKYFEEFGEVETAQVIFNRDTKKSRGFGFVVFRDPASVDRVLARQLTTSPPTIEGKPVEVKTCVARQDSQSMSGGNSPRAVPQTPIVTRSDSYSSLNSSSSVRNNNNTVTATPVRPQPSSSVFSPLPAPPPSTSHLAPRDPFFLSSPVVFDNNDFLNNNAMMGNDRRASFASSVRSNSPFGPLNTSNNFQQASPAAAHMDMHDQRQQTGGFMSAASFAGMQQRDSPSTVFYTNSSRFQALPPPQQQHMGGEQQQYQQQYHQQQQHMRQREDSSFSVDAFSGSLSAIPQQRHFASPVDSLPHATNGNNPDTGLFDLTHFALPTLPASTAAASSSSSANHDHAYRGRQIQESPTPGVMMMNSNGGGGSYSAFRPLSAPAINAASNPISPTKLVAKSPLLDHSLGQGNAFSAFSIGSSPNRAHNIW